MTEIIPNRMTAVIEGDFVVFILGVRINRLWKVYKRLPVFLAMPRIIKELERQPESGLLGSMSAGFMMVQYWRSFEHLVAYASSHDSEHWPAWVAFNERTAASRGDVGIWHETYVVRAGEYESIYGGVPRIGLGRAGNLVPAAGRRDSARGRMGGDRAAGAKRQARLPAEGELRSTGDPEIDS